MWLLLAALVPFVSGQSPLTRAWNEAVPGIRPYWEKYQTGPYGAIIRGWNFSRCAAEQWNDYPVNITNIVISPDKPRFPGPISLQVTMGVKEDLPLADIEVDLEVRHAVSKRGGSKNWEVIPCQGWNFTDGYGGAGSCRYRNVLAQCNDTIVGGFKYVKDRKIFKTNKDRKFLQRTNLCPPPKGLVSMTFSKEISSEEISHTIFGLRNSGEYWLTFNFSGENSKKLGCARLHLDVCKFQLKDKEQKCLKEPRPFTNCWGTPTSSAETIRNRGG